MPARQKWFSAALSRGLIEARLTVLSYLTSRGSFPRLSAAASLKRADVNLTGADLAGFPRLSAAASLKPVREVGVREIGAVFRGSQPRPH